MKKFFGVMILVAALIVIGQVKVEAAEVYMGSYSDGTSVYLLTHTISSTGHGYECDVRAGRDYLHYSVYMIDGSWKYSNSEGYRGFCYDGSSPVAANICTYVRNHH